MSIDPAFWRGKRVLLTGHTGFKGSWLSLWLQHLGARLAGLALDAPTNPNLFEVAAVGRGMASSVGDIRGLETVIGTVKAFQPEILIHMAAQPLVRLSYKEPIETYATNVMGTAHVLEAVRQCGSVRCAVVVTTDKCYENREWDWGYRENDPMGGHDPYSSSKGCAELVTAAYRRSFLGSAGVALASARAGNVIGGGDWAADRLVPDVLRAFAGGQQVTIRSPDSTRPWQHVLEPLGGYLLLAERMWGDARSYAEGWNFGPDEGDARPVRWIVERMARLWGEGAGWRLDDADHPHEANYLRLDTSRARHHLGWRPRWNLEGALARTVSWHRAWIKGGDMRRICLEQIGEYMDCGKGAA
ncbi:MAG TPA: CDP-glucose 4,6-dehydratase [Steroidobacteraceae bacterium]|nr:CDP-glucose 4,6-dehydratase [Steroidobacteraceae bacterium]